MILDAQIPLGELRTDTSIPLISFRVYEVSAYDALKIGAKTITYHDQGISVTLPFFVRLLWEGSIMAHSALWTPYYKGEYFPKEELLNDALVENLLSQEGSPYQRLLSWKQAKEIAFERKLVLDREDWESLDSIKYSKSPPAPEERFTLPRLETGPEPYNQIIAQWHTGRFSTLS